MDVHTHCYGRSSPPKMGVRKGARDVAQRWTGVDIGGHRRGPCCGYGGMERGSARRVREEWLNNVASHMTVQRMPGRLQVKLHARTCSIVARHWLHERTHRTACAGSLVPIPAFNSFHLRVRFRLDKKSDPFKANTRTNPTRMLSSQAMAWWRWFLVDLHIVTSVPVPHDQPMRGGLGQFFVPQPPPWVSPTGHSTLGLVAWELKLNEEKQSACATSSIHCTVRQCSDLVPRLSAPATRDERAFIWNYFFAIRFRNSRPTASSKSPAQLT